MEKRKLVNKSLSTQVADELEKSISSGVWKVGEKIPSESILMDSFGVSRNTLREAIRFLVISGVVDVRPGDGTYVITKTVFGASMKKRLAQESITHILETRYILEPQIVEIAATRRTQEELLMLRHCHTDLLVSYENKQENYVDFDTKFHIILAKSCHNPLLEDLYRAISGYFPQYVTENFSAFCAGNVDLFLHKSLMTAIENSDGVAARSITEDMIKLEMKMFVDY